MMNKKGAESRMWGSIISIIIIAIVIFAVVGLVIRFDAVQQAKDLFFGYEHPEDDPSYDEDYPGNTILRPEKIILAFQDGWGTTDIGYKCNGEEWFWGYEDEEDWFKAEEDWFKVEETTMEDFKKNYFTEKTWVLISNLKGKTCEEGVDLLAKRTIANSESRFGRSASLELYIVGSSDMALGKFTKNYWPDDGVLKSPNAFIKRLNRLTEVY